MACGNNNNRGGNLGGLKNILDFNVTYTGCETSCGGREIKTGDSLRNVLDALVANCDGGSGPVGSSTNFWFSRNVPTFTVDVKENDFALTGAGAIYEFVDGEWQNTGIQIGGSGGGGDSVWGSITGAIADQTDLTEYINLLITEAPNDENKLGLNARLDENGNITSGQKEPFLDQNGVTRHVILSPDQFDFADQKGSRIVMIDDVDLGVQFFQIVSQTTLDIESDQRVSLRSGNAGIDINSTGLPGGISGMSVSENIVQLKDSSGDGIRISPDLVSVKGLGVWNPDESTTKLGRTSGSYTGGIDIVNSGAAEGSEVLIGSKNSAGEYRPTSIRYGSSGVQISEDTQLTHKKYVDDLIAAQAATIADLTARIEALENA